MNQPVAEAAKLYPEGRGMSMATIAETTAELISLTTRIRDGQNEQHWFAVYTSANHEKRIAVHLEARGVDHFLPLYRSLRRWRDRTVRLNLPLFPGYLFVRLALDERLRVLEVPGVVRLVGFGGQPCPLPANEIDTLRRGVLSEISIVPHPYLKIGSRVRILRGPLMGSEGILVRRKNNQRVVLSLDLIARSVAVEVDLADVQRIGYSNLETQTFH